MEKSSASTRLAGAVHDLASEVVSALRGGGHSPAVCGEAGQFAGDDLGLAAVRVLGADLLLPSTLFRRRPQQADVTALHKAVRAFPPDATSSVVTVWSHWAMTQALHRLEETLAPGTEIGPGTETAPGTETGPGPGGRPAGRTDEMERERRGMAGEQPVAGIGPAGAGPAEPDVTWLTEAPWQRLTHQLAVLAALAVPGTDSGVARVAHGRPVDLARGFVRAVRRRDWLQAAAAGRWLALVDGVPDTLGLESGLEFVQHMGGSDARVALHVGAARLMRAGAPV
ncbi:MULTISPECIES: hypothetical protein [Streptomyces]|uniref:hypothetical protein n=1 Tax=Streptomyces TaxID=1883 RepID=UPI0004CB158E|nr:MULTISPECIES: hypothetical protein [Streptomyces]